MKKVEKVTRDEIGEARSNSNAPFKSRTAKPKNPKNQYIARLSMKNLKDFFGPFNVSVIEKYPNDNEPEFIYVACENFEVTFNDYETIFQITSPIDKNMKSGGDFDFYKFLEYCDGVDIYPDQAFSTMIATSLFGKRFGSYSSDYEKFKKQTANSAYSSLPKATKRILEPVKDSVENQIVGNKNHIVYGTSNIEDLIRSDNA